jgi:hypothetical protein
MHKERRCTNERWQTRDPTQHAEKDDGEEYKGQRKIGNLKKKGHKASIIGYHGSRRGRRTLSSRVLYTPAALPATRRKAYGICTQCGISVVVICHFLNSRRSLMYFPIVLVWKLERSWLQLCCYREISVHNLCEFSFKFSMIIQYKSLNLG